MTGDHLHVVWTPGAKVDVQAEHLAWHATREPCLFCDARAWHGCPLTAAHLSDWAREPRNSDCYGKGM